MYCFSISLDYHPTSFHWSRFSQHLVPVSWSFLSSFFQLFRWCRRSWLCRACYLACVSVSLKFLGVFAHQWGQISWLRLSFGCRIEGITARLPGHACCYDSVWQPDQGTLAHSESWSQLYQSNDGQSSTAYWSDRGQSCSSTWNGKPPDVKARWISLGLGQIRLLFFRRNARGLANACSWSCGFDRPTLFDFVLHLLIVAAEQFLYQFARLSSWTRSSWCFPPFASCSCQTCEKMCLASGIPQRCWRWTASSKSWNLDRKVPSADPLSTSLAQLDYSLAPYSY